MMIGKSNRYRKITWFFARAILNIGFYDILLARLGFRNYISRTRPKRLRRIAARYRELAVAMGGVLIKVGQFLSARVDVLPEDITDELAGLQDEVPAVAFPDICRVAEADLGCELGQMFSFVEPTPMASASLGQVHRARLRLRYLDAEGVLSDESACSTGNDENTGDVVVKIQRPNIEKIIATDLAAIKTVGSWLQLYVPLRRRANVPALIQEFARVLYEEIDYLAEGRNIETFAENFKGNPKVCVPKVVWTHTTRKVLTMEDVGGIKIDSYADISASGIDRHEVAVVVLQVYFKQIFEDGFFHADPHPGNLFIKLIDSGNLARPSWKLTFVDFGMVGRISATEKSGLRELLIAFATRDSERLIRAYQLLNILLPEADLDLIRLADQSAFDLIWGKNMSELIDISPSEITELLSEFRELVYQMPFQVPHDLIFLARAIGLLSGLCTGLDADINVWELIVPYARKLISADDKVFLQDGVTEALLKIISEFGSTVQKMASLPNMAYSVLNRIDHGDLIMRDPKLENALRKLIQSVQKLTVSVVLLAFVFVSTQLYLGDEFLPAIFTGIISSILLLWIIFHR
jgi:predicted unusual protein kinase regulating ubiquinone biosynthesis (AarF/ABC1/UbiB family)